MTNTDKLAQVVADGLNEYAATQAAGQMLDDHRPASPLFWFYALARDQAALCRSKRFRMMLSREARGYLNAKPSWWGRSKVKQVNGIWKALDA
jgi:hypothetical protein